MLFKKKYSFVLFPVVLGLCCCVWALSLAVVTAAGCVASLLRSTGSGVCRLQWRGAQASFPLSTWNLPGPAIEPASPHLAGSFLATVPPAWS